jgi:hypothetical protein
MNTKSWRVRSLVGAATIAVTAGVAIGATGVASDVFAVDAPSSATSAEPPAQVSAPAPQAPPGVKKQTLVGTYVESGNADNETLGANATVPLDGVNNKLACPAGHTCTITSTISVQVVDHGAHTNNLVALPWQIDGTSAGEGGPFVGTTSTSGLLGGFTWTDQQAGVAAGKHTVQSFVLTQQGGSLFSWTVIYNVYD